MAAKNPKSLTTNGTAIADVTDVTKIYAKILMWSFFATLGIGFILLMLFYGSLIFGIKNPDGSTSSPPTIEVVIALGALGAFFSSLIRLYGYKDLPKIFLVKDLREMSDFPLAVYSMVPPIVGAIAAAILYVAFGAGLLEGGAIFPEFACKPIAVGGEPDCSRFSGVLDQYGPAKEQDYFRVMIWGFIAGFAERLVPDTLSTFAKQQRSGLASNSEGEIEH